MSPRQLRESIGRGEWTAAVSARKLPEPPPEWSQWRRDRMAVAIRCASLFLFNNYSCEEIMSKVGREGVLTKSRVTKQRISQLVTKGTEFLVRRGVFVKVSKPKSGAVK